MMSACPRVPTRAVGAWELSFTGGGGLGFIPAPLCRSPKGLEGSNKHKDLRDAGFWNPPLTGPWSQYVGSLCLCGPRNLCWHPCAPYAPTVSRFRIHTGSPMMTLSTWSHAVPHHFSIHPSLNLLQTAPTRQALSPKPQSPKARSQTPKLQAKGGVGFPLPNRPE